MRFLRQFARRLRPGKPSLQSLLDGYRSTALLYAAAKLKIPDHLARQPLSISELSAQLQVDTEALHRLLRGLVALGICAEKNPGVFELTPMGNRLRSDVAGPEYNLAILNGEEYAPAWNHLWHSVKTGETAFDNLFGETPWQHRQKNPELNQRFNTWLERGAAEAGTELLSVYDFSCHQIATDIGGGQGALLSAVLKGCPSLNGILFDQPHVVAEARIHLASSGLSARCEIIEGDFFKTVPAGADVYILKSILHDWDDETCGTILKHCRAAMKDGQALLVLEKLMPARVEERPSTVLGDLHMLAVTGGCERTAEEYGRMFAAAGFALKKISPLKTGHSVLEVAAV